MSTTVRKKKRKFKLMGGLHYAVNPAWEAREEKTTHDPDRHVVYKKGDIVESEEDLRLKYRDQFMLVEESEAPEVTDERRAAVSALIAAGRYVEEDRDFLETLSGDGFARVSRAVGQQQAQQVTEDRPRAVSHLGEDVTHLFQRAYDEGYKVFRNPAGKHQVCKPGDTKKPVNPKALEAPDVDAFVDRYIKEMK